MPNSYTEISTWFLLTLPLCVPILMQVNKVIKMHQKHCTAIRVCHYADLNVAAIYDTE